MKKLIRFLDPQSTITITILVVIILFSLQTIGNISSNKEDRSEAIEEILIKASIQCYALEGSYPPDIDYLRKNYGIIIDDEQYFYFYDTNGANIAPNIEVIKR